MKLLRARKRLLLAAVALVTATLIAILTYSICRIVRPGDVKPKDTPNSTVFQEPNQDDSPASEFTANQQHDREHLEAESQPVEQRPELVELEKIARDLNPDSDASRLREYLRQRKAMQVEDEAVAALDEKFESIIRAQAGSLRPELQALLSSIEELLIGDASDIFEQPANDSEQSMEAA